MNMNVNVFTLCMYHNSAASLIASGAKILEVAGSNRVENIFLFVFGKIIYF